MDLVRTVLTPSALAKPVRFTRLGESEFWFALIKVIAVVVFLVLGVAMILGIIGGQSPGFSNWTIDDAPFPGGMTAILAVFMIAGFSFQGTELVGVAAGESKDPEKDVPRSIRTIFIRIMLFYIGAILVVSFLTSIIGNGGAYICLVNVSGLAGFIVWMGIAWSHYRFRKAYVAQGWDIKDLKYRARWFPLGPIIALLMCGFVILGQNYQAFFGSGSLIEIVSSYIGLPIFVAVWVGHKLVTKAKPVKLEQADLTQPKI